MPSPIAGSIREILISSHICKWISTQLLIKETSKYSHTSPCRWTVDQCCTRACTHPHTYTNTCTQSSLSWLGNEAESMLPLSQSVCRVRTLIVRLVYPSSICPTANILGWLFSSTGRCTLRGAIQRNHLCILCKHANPLRLTRSFSKAIRWYGSTRDLSRARDWWMPPYSYQLIEVCDG